jgi:anti-sigma factor (TIGR02949 family)
VTTRPPDRYTCEEMFRRLDDYLDRELTPDETRIVEAHLEICALCATEFAFEAGVLKDVRRKLRHIEVPSSLRDKVARAIRGGSDKPTGE